MSAVERQVRGEPLDLLGEGRPRLLELRFGGDLLERPPLAGQLLVERVSGSSPAGSTKSAVTSFRNS